MPEVLKSISAVSNIDMAVLSNLLNSVRQRIVDDPSIRTQDINDIITVYNEWIKHRHDNSDLIRLMGPSGPYQQTAAITTIPMMASDAQNGMYRLWTVPGVYSFTNDRQNQTTFTFSLCAAGGGGGGGAGSGAPNRNPTAGGGGGGYGEHSTTDITLQPNESAIIEIGSRGIGGAGTTARNAIAASGTNGGASRIITDNQTIACIGGTGGAGAVNGWDASVSTGGAGGVVGGQTGEYRDVRSESSFIYTARGGNGGVRNDIWSMYGRGGNGGDCTSKNSDKAVAYPGQDGTDGYVGIVGNPFESMSLLQLRAPAQSIFIRQFTALVNAVKQHSHRVSDSWYDGVSLQTYNADKNLSTFTSNVTSAMEPAQWSAMSSSVIFELIDVLSALITHQHTYLDKYGP